MFICFTADGILCDLQGMGFFVIYRGCDSIRFTGNGILNHRGYVFICFTADGILCDFQGMGFFVIYKGRDSV